MIHPQTPTPLVLTPSHQSPFRATNMSRVEKMRKLRQDLQSGKKKFSYSEARLARSVIKPRPENSAPVTQQLPAAITRCSHLGETLDNAVCKPCQGLHPLYECEIYGTCCNIPSKHVLSEADRLAPINLARGTDSPQTCQTCPLHSSNRQVVAPVTVVAIFHNYGKYLSECMESLQWQTHLPREIILIDSGSTDDTYKKLLAFEANPTNYGFFQGDLEDKKSSPIKTALTQRINSAKVRSKYRVLQNHSGNLWDARKLGFDESCKETSFILYIDGDDMLSPLYIQNCLEVFSEVPNAAIVRGDHQCFGDSIERESYGYHQNYQESGDLHRYNCIPGSGAMIRKESIFDTRPFDGIYKEEINSRETHEDWLLFKRILKHQWRLASVSSSCVLYRKHGDTLLKEVMRSPYPLRAGVNYDPLTIVVPISGREYGKDAIRWLSKQPRKSNTHVILLDCRASKNDPSWFPAFMLPDLLNDYASVEIVKVDLPDSNTDSDRLHPQEGLSTERRMARIYNHLHGRLDHKLTPFTFILEDDVRPPLNALEILFSKLTPNVDAVSGVYPSRWHEGSWHAEFIPGHSLTTEDRRDQKPTYDSPYGLAGVGCALLRTDILSVNGRPFRTTIESDSLNGWTDVKFWQDARLERPNNQHLVCWEVECGHADIKASWES